MNRVKTVFYAIYPALQVHTWGGLGSQLFAAHAILRLRSRFPYRRIVLVIHTSGVTKRIPELNFNLLAINLRLVDDFNLIIPNNKNDHDNTSKQKFLWSNFKKLGKSLLKYLYFFAEANDEMNYKEVRPWTIMLRGHYTQLKLDEKALREISKSLFREPNLRKTIPEVLVVHYRLGDLMYLEEKSPVSVKRIDQIIDTFPPLKNSILLLADSKTLDSVEFLSNSKNLRYIEVVVTDPITTLELCMVAGNFLGTTSKISLWAAIFRKFILGKASYLPQELKWAERAGLDSNWY